MEMVLKMTPEELQETVQKLVEEEVEKKLKKVTEKLSKVKVAYKNKREAAEFLGVSLTTIERYMRDGKNGQKLPYEKPNGKNPLFKTDDLIRFQSII